MKVGSYWEGRQKARSRRRISKATCAHMTAKSTVRTRMREGTTKRKRKRKNPWRHNRKGREVGVKTPKVVGLTWCAKAIAEFCNSEGTDFDTLTKTETEHQGSGWPKVLAFKKGGGEWKP